MPNLDTAYLTARFQDQPAQTVVRSAIEDLFPARVALVSSFGTEAAVLLHMVALIDRHTPVIFLDTLKHFEETLAYRDRLVDRLRLTDVRTVQPAGTEVAKTDPTGMLWATDNDACCEMRKVRPLAEAIHRFGALITGRKRHHGSQRSALPVFEDDGVRLKVNPLARWDGDTVAQYMATHQLPRHPLIDQGFPSVGCAVCTARVQPGEDFRAGRWRGSGKTECGIHFPPPPR